MRRPSRAPAGPWVPASSPPALLGCSLGTQPSLVPTAQLRPLHQHRPGARHQAAGDQRRPL